jgi:hypothetical protein
MRVARHSERLDQFDNSTCTPGNHTNYSLIRVLEENTCKTMPGLEVPPSGRRRRRVVDEDDEDEQSTRATTPLSQSSTGSKRIRLDDPAEKSDNEDDINFNFDQHVDAEQPVAKVPLTKSALPAGYTTYKDFQPGAIVRMKLKDFVTYTNVEYHFGSQLNMIIGPNGTGKSTLVCAICLGLGWGPQVGLGVCWTMVLG